MCHGEVMQLNDISKKLETALDNFTRDLNHEIKISETDSETKKLCEQISRKTLYALTEFKEVILNHLNQ
jgi:hypothetical protein